MLNGEYDRTEKYDVEIPINTSEDNEMDALMDATRPILQKDFEGCDEWENGEYKWTIHDFEKQ